MTQEGTQARRQTGTKGRRAITPCLRASMPSCLARRTGFSFAEVMFAVIVLGIGFIMIAAIFPVAISQTQASLSDTAGATVGRTGTIYMANLVSQGTGSLGLGDVTSYANTGTVGFPGGDGLVHPIDGPGAPTPVLAPLAPPRWDRLKGNFIESIDPRFAWIPIGYKMYDEGANGTLGNKNIVRYAEFYILAVQSQNSSMFDSRDLDAPTSPGSAPFNVANLRPKSITGVIIEDNNPTYGVDTATFPPFADDAHTPIAPGAFILVSNDNRANTHELNGQYYRLGANIAPNIWELQPGNDYQPVRDAAGVVIPTPITVDVLTVGRGYDNASAPTQYQGPAMDLFMLPPVVAALPVPPGP